MATITRCSCGRRMSRNSGISVCGKCHEARMNELYDAASVVVSTGKCPDCGSSLRRNLSLTGWWQCEQVGAVGFRANADKAACGFQVFTRN